MGIYRLLLALSVVVMHCDGVLGRRFLVAGDMAVVLFFQVSGFYMALVLDRKYRGPGATRLFLGNRALRLLPTYYAVLGLLALTCLAGWAATGRPPYLGQLGMWHQHAGDLPGWLAGLLGAVQATPVGQEWADLVRWDPVGHQLVAARGPQRMLLHVFMILPPAWSLGVELQFYLLAPALARLRLGWMAVVGAGSLALQRLLPGRAPGTVLFWEDRFVLSLLHHFVAGMISYRAYRCWEPFWNSPRTRPWRLVAWAGGIALLAAFPWVPRPLAGVLVPLLFAALLPAVFATWKDSAADRWIGDLSYPLYIGHWFVRSVVDGVLARVRPGQDMEKLPYTVLVAACSLALAAALMHWLERPIDRFRQRRVARAAATGTATAGTGR